MDLPPPPPIPDAAKAEIRRAVLRRRRAVDPARRHDLDRALVARLTGFVHSGDAVTAYAPDGGEAGGPGLPSALATAGASVWLPVSPPDGALEWSRFSGDADLRPGRFGIPVPSSTPIRAADLPPLDLVLVPAIAVDLSGARLGRGGGYYDRSLSALPGRPLRLAVLDDEDVLNSLPRQDHDLGVDGIITPSCVHRFGTWHSTE